MIAFGCSITKPDQFRRCAEPGIRRAADGDSVRYELPAVGSIARSYNALLDRAVERADLEALVLVHQDAEIVDADLCVKVRAALSDPDVAVVGCAGALDVRSIAWWEGSVTLASFINRYEDHGGGDLPSFSWSRMDAPPWAQTGEVETLDGFVLVLSPWAVRSVRFDESLSRFHGYDLDYCLQVREAGRKVITADFRAIHHRQIEMLPEPEEWIEAHIAVAEKWDGRMPRVGTAPGGWRERALRAEADRDAAGALAHTKVVELEARARELRRGIAETRGSLSWRLSAPLRRRGA
jgi:Glycosyltransferase like family